MIIIRKILDRYQLVENGNYVSASLPILDTIEYLIKKYPRYENINKK